MKKRRWIPLLLSVVLCCSFAACAADRATDIVPEQAVEVRTTFRREADLDNAPAIGIKQEHLEKNASLMEQYQAEGWEAVESTLCAHGGGVVYNDVTFRRIVEGVTKTRHFCVWQSCDFEP